MSKNNCTSHTSTTFFGTLFLLLINFHGFSYAAGGGGGGGGGSLVKFLPGFDGPLPFEFETGYIGVGESEDVQLFYYFMQSESNPTTDPILLWFTGGPGCSSLYALLFELGPITFDVKSNEQYNQQGYLKLVLNPYSWTQIASIIFLDLPVGTGFSYARNTKAAQTGDQQSSDHVHEFLRKWLVDHPQFVSNPVYLGGDSASGLTIPVIAQLIADGNDIGLEPKIELKGCVLGNAKTSPNDYDYRIQYAHGMGLISDELFESLKESCSGNYFDIDPTNGPCLQNMSTYNKLIRDINRENILEAKCPDSENILESDSPRDNPRKMLGETRFQSDLLNLEIRKEGPSSACLFDKYKLINPWANDKQVQEAFHIRKGTMGEWKRCKFDIPYNISITDVVPYHAKLSSIGYRSLIYSGDHDMSVPFIATEAWIKSLNYSIVDDWRPWIVDGQVGGYTRTYTNRITFATVKGAGHVAPTYKPQESRSMFERWISYRPL